MSAVLLPLALALMASTGDPTAAELLPPGDILRRARVAIDQARTLRYTFHYEGSGTMAGELMGSMMIRRPWKGDRAWIRATVVDRSSGDPEKPDARLALASDGKQVQRIDLDAGTLMQGALDQGASPLLVTAYLGIPGEFLTDAPLDGGNRGSQLRYVGSETVEEISCHLIEVVTPVPGGRMVVRWYLSKQDYLPRRLTRENDIPEAPGGMRLDLMNLAVDVLVNASQFRLAVPVGMAEVPFAGPIIEVGAPAPAFRLQTPGGEWVSSEDLRGKVAVVTFWASWCARCRLLQDALAALAAELEDQPLAIVGINAWEQEPEAPRAFLRKHPAAYPMLLAGDPVAARYGLAVLPGLYVIGPDGRFLAVDGGLGTAGVEDLRALLETALAGLSGSPAEPGTR